MGDEVNEMKMDAVLRKLRVSVPWYRIKELYDNFENVFKADAHQNIGEAAFKHFATVFHFKFRTADKCRGELMYWLKNHQEFYNDDLKIVYDRMVQKRDELQQQQIQMGCSTPIPYINWMPQYGGYIFGTGRAKQEDEFHRDANVPYIFGD